jgi:hypothetical protein
MASALFTTNGSSTQAAKVVTFGSTVNYALVNAAGVNTVEYLIFGGDGLYFATAPVLSGAVGNATQVMPADPGRDIGFGVECLVNGGLDGSGRPDPTLRCRRVVGTTVYGADIPIVAGETTERDSASGWVGPLNRRLIGVLGPLAVRTLTSDTTYTPTVGTRAILVECWGGGGAGGGCATGATYSAAAGGGSAGGYAASWLTGAAIKASYVIAIGAAGAAGAAGANPGGAGGDTTFDSPSVCTAIGGAGGAANTVGAVPHVGGAGGVSSGSNVGNLFATHGDIGTMGLCMSATVAISGKGTSSMVGKGGTQRYTQANGYGATGRSSGGGGGCILSGGADVAGGAGTAGLIRVWEYGG